MTKINKAFIQVIVVLFAGLSIFAQSPDRKDVPEQYKWNLADIYPSVSDWQTDVNMLNSEVDNFSVYQGKLGESADVLYDALSTASNLAKTLYKTWTYASNLSNQDLNNSEAQAMMQQMTAIGTKFGEVTAFFDPEILQIPTEKIDMFFAEKPELKEKFDMYIDNIQRLRTLKFM